MNLPVSPFTIEHLSKSIRTGELLPSELTRLCLGRIRKLNNVLNSFITIRNEDEIFEFAERCDKRLNQNDLLHPLYGIPYSIKDMIHAKHLKFTAGSKFYSNCVSNTTASIVKILDKKGAILIGTNNLNEFASGITGKNSIYGDSKNPWDLSRISGGSSGGSAVAVASGMVLFSLGTDTGGSVRVPASLCGLVGMKPTFGLISTFGVFPLSPSLDHVGWLTRSVWDANLIFKSLEDKNCRKARKNAMITHKLLRASKLVIGIPNGYFLNVIDSRIKKMFIDFLRIVSQSTLLVKNFEIDHTNNFFTSWKKVRLYEASMIHANRLESNTGQFGSDMNKMLIEGLHIPVDDYIQAKKQIKKIKHKFMNLFSSGISAILLPTTVILAPKLRKVDIEIDDLQLNVRKALLRNTVLFNSIGFPAITIPLGFVTEKAIMLPVGLQIIGPKYGDRLVLLVAKKLEELVGSHSMLNPINRKDVQL
ncbi:MAG: amidase [Candidatus Nitrosocosmicus sp.]|nr:amidase [Candidatus Nitrosocosmicus sp.]MDN5866951.1 amidase [Candidatus Nitrosocosmicus sp.]